MALRKILYFPHPNLRIKAAPVTEFNEDLKKLVDDMFETMYAYRGGGLAATQIDVHQRLFIMDWGNDSHGKLVLINPEITNIEGEQVCDEGCLSFPGVYATLKRPLSLTVTFQNILGETQKIDAEGLLAECIHHENDHLDGVVYSDYLTPVKRQRLMDKMKKYQREML